MNRPTGRINPLSLRLRFVAAMLVLIGAGLAVRLLPLGLTRFAVKYLGSSLWGAMVFAGAGVAKPRLSPKLRVAAALAIAIATELFRLYHAPALDAFRLTLAGKLLLGRVFSLWNIVAYALGIVTAALLERAGALHQRHQRVRDDHQQEP